ncbi:Conserved_hypothetical protein [Hexamita inflata]|uniref:Uncharacterized protein n=1 Tax=Hexamita inflata TaxID=28002 RepID=A0AA86QDU1_9EUKA|nr:Conserved hypothetical protein [Hexamita inflata]
MSKESKSISRFSVIVEAEILECDTQFKQNFTKVFAVKVKQIHSINRDPPTYLGPNSITVINMSQIEFTCESDIGDATTDIKGTCKDRLKLYKDKIVTGKRVAFTFSVPTKFDYSEYTYSEDYTLIYVAIGSYCGGLALFGTIFLLILVYKTKQKDE